ncbi:MAG TPA: HAD family hydrolase [Saprospiraceae bacterium]|nr:HAD family hydrolase [Saprospiraceae bacterium]
MAVKSLFLDRDGVINERIPNAYINRWDDFHFCQGAVEALQLLQQHFDHLFIVTNQQGIGKGLMTVKQLEDIHEKMLKELQKAEVSVDAVYFCGTLKQEEPNCRKPNPAMGLQAKKDFPTIDFGQSIMVGDSIVDLQFGRNLSMRTVLITTKLEEQHLWIPHKADWDWRFPSLWDWAKSLEAR